MGFGCVLYYQTNMFIFISMASAVSAAICVWLTASIFRQRNINIVRLVVYQSVIWYFLPLSYYILLDTSGLLVVTEADMAGSVILILIELSIAWCLSLLLDIRVTFPLQEPAFLRARRDLILVLLPICAAQLFFMATGAWSYETTHATTDTAQGAADMAARSPVLTLVGNIAAGVAPMVAYNYGLLSDRERSFSQKLILISVMAIEIPWSLIESRRMLLMVIALAGMAFSLGRMKSKFTLQQILSVALAGLFFGFVLVQANKVFYTMRLASAAISSRGGDKLSSFANIIEAMKSVPAETVSAEVGRNLASRPYIIESVGIFKKNAHGFLYGKELLDQTILTIPGALFPGKEQFLASFRVPEQLWDSDLGVPINDYANSFILDGYADFAYLGFFIHCSVSAFLFLLTIKIYSLLGNQTLNYLCIFGFIFAFLQVETSYGSFLVQARDFLIFFVVVASCHLFLDATRALAPAPRWRARPLKLE
jgi:hypothetical protein